tara:strand:- start:11974 stop:12390 length:417 start_codon:yes stop_codon:yes gene_type:complete
MNRKAKINFFYKLANRDVSSNNFVEYIKSLESPQERPSGFRRGSLKIEKISKVCCWCSSETLVGVEHIIPRSAGGPPVDRWNLAWACYTCNHYRGSQLSPPFRKGASLSGWLTEAFLGFKEQIPTAEELKEYFHEQKK